MSSQVSITSQGQISIPAKIRQELGIKVPSSAIVKIEDNKIVIEPIKDLLELKGILSTKTRRNKGTDKIIEEEEEAAINYVIEKYPKKHE